GAGKPRTPNPPFAFRVLFRSGTVDQPRRLRLSNEVPANAHLLRDWASARRRGALTTPREPHGDGARGTLPHHAGRRTADAAADRIRRPPALLRVEGRARTR